MVARRGMSLFRDLQIFRQAYRGKFYYVEIPPQDLPDGLGIYRDNTNHFLIYPTRVMPIAEFRQKLGSLAIGSIIKANADVDEDFDPDNFFHLSASARTIARALAWKQSTSQQLVEQENIGDLLVMLLGCGFSELSSLDPSLRDFYLKVLQEYDNSVQQVQEQSENPMDVEDLMHERLPVLSLIRSIEVFLVSLFATHSTIGIAREHIGLFSRGVIQKARR